jgi:hypothetical protein
MPGVVAVQNEKGRPGFLPRASIYLSSFTITAGRGCRAVPWQFRLLLESFRLIFAHLFPRNKGGRGRWNNLLSDSELT